MGTLRGLTDLPVGGYANAADVIPTEDTAVTTPDERQG